MIDVWRGVAVGRRMKHAKSAFQRASKRQTSWPRKGIDVWPWQQDRFDRGKRRRTGSTPAVVPGAAPALAKTTSLGPSGKCPFRLRLSARDPGAVCGRDKPHEVIRLLGGVIH